MNSDQPRRAATVPLPVPQDQQNPPPAPPLPPPQSRARNAINRILGIPPRASDGDDDGLQETRYWAEANRATTVGRPSLTAHNASASHKTGLEINSVSINDDGTHALLAGREILKTIRVDEGSCTEDVNLRAAIQTSDTNVIAGATAKDAVNIHDVAWGKGHYGNFIAAATYNGPLLIYDLHHPGVEVAKLTEHRRQIHRVTFNPHAGQHFLSGSQDGTVRLWDVRDLRRDSASFPSRFTTTGQHEGVRDVKWSPTDIFALALCTDGGFVQKWDTRKLKTPLTKIAAHTRIAAHTSPCTTIDWHPDGNHLLSASADKTVKVWNLSAEGSRRNKPAYEINTPYPLRNARWRPSCQSSIPGDRSARQCSQIVASYERDYNVLHIWDFRRPSLPFREIHGYRSAPTDLLWHSQDLLWTVGRDGMFIQHDIKYTAKVMDKRNMQTLAVSPLGDINIATQKRSGKVRSRLDEGDADQLLPHPHRRFADEKRGSEQSISRGSTDDSVDESFLSSSFGKKYGRRGSSTKGSKLQLDQPPTSAPSDPLFNARTMPLEDVLAKKKVFKPGQGAASGTLPGAQSPLVFMYFTQKYKTRPLSEPPSVESFLRVQDLFEANAAFAEKASMYRMAQSWRIAGHAVQNELKKRAHAHRELRVRGSQTRKSMLEESPFARRTRKYLASERRINSKPNTPLARPVKTMEAFQPTQMESTSNVPTPLAKPVSDRPSAGHTPLKEITRDDADLALPPSLLAPVNQGDTGRGRQLSTQSDVAGGSWYGSTQAYDQRRAELSEWRARSKEPLSLEPTAGEAVNIRPQKLRQNSDESFAMFPSLSSRDASNPASSVVSMGSLMNTVHENLMESSPSGSMNLGSSSSSEPNLSQHATSYGFYSYEPPAEMIRSDLASPSPEAHQGEEDANAESKPRSPGQPKDIPPVRDMTQDMHTLALNNQHSFSSDSEGLSLSAGRKPSVDSQPLHNISEETEDLQNNMEASMTIVPTHARSRSRLFRSREGSSSITRPTALYHNAESAPAALPRRPSIHPENVPFTPSDFFGIDHPVDTETDRPFTLIEMLSQLLVYHSTNVVDAQAASHFLLLITPLLPETHPLPQREIDQTISAYSEHFAALGYTDEEIYQILNSSFEHSIKSGLQPLQAEAIFSTYHEQLLQASLYSSAAYLRRLAFPTYPSVYEQGLKDNAVAFLCGACKKPINNPLNKFRCESCEQRTRSCCICFSATSPFEPEPRKSKRQRREAKHRASADVHTLITGPRGGQEQQEQQHQTPESGDELDDSHTLGLSGAGAASAAATVTAAKPTLYSTCLLCNHTAHTACLREWHAMPRAPGHSEEEEEEEEAQPPSPKQPQPQPQPQPPSSSPSRPPPQSPHGNPLSSVSGGACPTPGCLCACGPGLWRNTQLAPDGCCLPGKAGRHGKNKRVNEDEWVVPESKAAVQAGDLLGVVAVATPAVNGGAGGGASTGDNPTGTGTGTGTATGTTATTAGDRKTSAVSSVHTAPEENSGRKRSATSNVGDGGGGRGIFAAHQGKKNTARRKSGGPGRIM